MSPATPIYNRGDALRYVKNNKDKIIQGSDPEAAATFAADQAVKGFGSYRYYYAWAGSLLRYGRRLVQVLDEFQLRVQQAGDHFYDRRSGLKRLVADLISYQVSIRNYEHGVGQFINAYAVTLIRRKVNETLAVQAIAREVQDSFGRVYMGAQAKLENISRSRVTATTILISVAALVMAIISLWKR